MIIGPKTKIGELLEGREFLIDFLGTISPMFKNLRNPIMRKTMGKIATLGKIAKKGKVDLDRLLKDIAKKVQDQTGEVLRIEGSEAGSSETDQLSKADRQVILKDIIIGVHDGEDMSLLKSKFRKLIKDVDPGEIAEMEQNLIDEGMPEEEVKRLCDVHVEIFKESLDQRQAPNEVPGHPIHTFMLENRRTEAILEDLEAMIKGLGDEPRDDAFQKAKGELIKLMGILGEVNIHYLRKENQLFPLLEAYKVSGPSSVMWALHDDVRSHIKEVKKHIDDGEAAEAINKMKWLILTINDMIYKEDNILFPMSLEKFTLADWKKVRKGEEEIGYAWVEPEADWPPQGIEDGNGSSGYNEDDLEMGPSRLVELNVGNMTQEQISLILTHIPIEISFVDETDRVRFYSGTKDRIFPRSPGVIGREVRNCHPRKSLRRVLEILESFKEGEKDMAEFWITTNEARTILIRYYALRDDDGVYKGTIEVIQDITDLKKIRGEKRILERDKPEAK